MSGSGELSADAWALVGFALLGQGAWLRPLESSTPRQQTTAASICSSRWASRSPIGKLGWWNRTDDGQTWTEPRALVPGDRGWARASQKQAPRARRWHVAGRGLAGRRGRVGGLCRSQHRPRRDLAGQRSHNARDRSLFTGHGAIQPTLWESAPGQVHMLVRSTCGQNRSAATQRTEGGLGRRFIQRTYPTTTAASTLARLHNGTLALVCNPVERMRTPLSILLSTDNGQTWPRRLDLETADGEYSYPAIIPTQVGMAITYTWKRERIAFWHGSVEQVPNTD